MLEIFVICKPEGPKHASKDKFYSTRYFIKTNDREAFFCSNLKWVMASKKGTIKCMANKAVLPTYWSYYGHIWIQRPIFIYIKF